MSQAAGDRPPDAVVRRRLPPDERRESILDAAARLFEHQPYSQVSTVAIAREAGIARGLLNHYFGDKRGLYLEVVRRSVLLPTLEDLPTRVPGSMAEKVEVAVQWFLDSVEPRVASYLTVLGAEGVADDEEVASIIRRADDLAAQRVLELVGLDPADERSLALVRCYGGLAKTTVHEWARRETLSRPQAHEIISDVLLFLTSDLLQAHPHG